MVNTRNTTKPRAVTAANGSTLPPNMTPMEFDDFAYASKGPILKGREPSLSTTAPYEILSASLEAHLEGGRTTEFSISPRKAREDHLESVRPSGSLDRYERPEHSEYPRMTMYSNPQVSSYVMESERPLPTDHRPHRRLIEPSLGPSFPPPILGPLKHMVSPYESPKNPPMEEYVESIVPMPSRSLHNWRDGIRRSMEPTMEPSKGAPLPGQNRWQKWHMEYPTASQELRRDYLPSEEPFETLLSSTRLPYQIWPAEMKYSMIPSINASLPPLKDSLSWQMGSPEASYGQLWDERPTEEPFRTSMPSPKQPHYHWGAGIHGGSEGPSPSGTEDSNWNESAKQSPSMTGEPRALAT